MEAAAAADEAEEEAEPVAEVLALDEVADAANPEDEATEPVEEEAAELAEEEAVEFETVPGAPNVPPVTTVGVTTVALVADLK